MAYLGDEVIYLGGNSFVLRFNSNIECDPKFFSYYTQTRRFHLAVIKYVRGATTHYINTGSLIHLKVPLPPLEVQKEIVEILEKFDYSKKGLLGSLKKELALREKQYTYYRAQLLKFPKEGEDLKKPSPRRVLVTQKQHNDPHALLPQTLLHKFQSTPVIWKTIGELGEVVSGKGLTKAELLDSGPVGCIYYGQLSTEFGALAYKTVSFVTKETAEKCTKVYKGDIIFQKASQVKRNICKAVAYVGESPIVAGVGSTVFRVYSKQCDSKFLSYYTQAPLFRAEVYRYMRGAAVYNMNNSSLKNLKVPLPPLEVQKEIVSILEEKESLKESLKEEIRLREKQYKYYRSQLLNFQNPSHYPLNNLKTL